MMPIMWGIIFYVYLVLIIAQSMGINDLEEEEDDQS